MFPLFLIILSEEEIDKLQEIVRLYEKKLYLFAVNLLQDRCAAEDVVQETFYKIIKGIDRIDDVYSASTKSYLNMVLYHTALDLIKKKNREESLSEWAEEINLSMEDSIDLDQAIAEGSFEGDIGDFVSKLSRDDQELIELKFSRDLSNEQISQYYGVGEAAIKKRWQRAKQRLVRLMEKKGGAS